MSDGRLKRIADWTVRLGLPLAVFCIVLAVFFGEQMGIEHEVSLVVGSSAVRGQTLPVRVMVLTDLGALEGPRIVSLPVDVTLTDTGGNILLEQRLDASAAGGADGTIQIPADAPAVLVLRAAAQLEGRSVASVSSTFGVSDASEAEELVGRLAQATAHFDEGALEIIEGQTPPSVLGSRVVGGACVPEAPCSLIVNVGEPAALVRVAPTSSVTIEHTPTESTAGLARISLVVHGPDAQVSLEAVRDGALVARRRLRLPVALATPGVVAEHRIRVPAEGPTLRVSVVGEPAGVIFDAYEGGRWARTGSRTPSAEPFEAPASGRGLWRLQVRTDPFSSRRASSRMMLREGSDLDEAIAQLNLMAGGTRAPSPAGPDELRFAWAAAALEVGHYELPRAVHGLEQDRAALEERQSTLRVAALVAMMLGLLVLAVLLLRRGLGAAREAQRVMEATGDPALSSDAHRRRTLLSALVIVATMLLAFVAAGAMIIARAHLLE